MNFKYYYFCFVLGAPVDAQTLDCGQNDFFDSAYIAGATNDNGIVI